jgi:hypothetical protein
VYLSFCVEDSRSFVLSIYRTLTKQHGLVVFLDNLRFGFDDDQPLLRPSESTLNVIGDCKIAIIVLSKNYTNSSWCLQELEKITECCQTTAGLTVLPFLYHGVYSRDRNIPLPRCLFPRQKISMEETSKKEDKFMSWVAAISHYTGYIYDGPKYLIKVPYR